MTVNPAPRNGGVAMENYVTWSELIQLIIAFANVGTFIVAIIALFSNKGNNRPAPPERLLIII